jgi:peptidoglycan/LPS O-acetylase OafA/YrhL
VTTGSPVGAQRESRGRELDLDVVRGTAILLAMGWHFNQRSGVAAVDALLWPGRTFGWVGVDLFFVLSGFWVGRLVLEEAVQTGRFDSWRFAKRRALKLWPVLYFYLLVEVVIGDNGWRTFLVQDIFHVQNYTGTSLDQLWSLGVEEHFYLAVLVLFPFFLRAKGGPGGLLMALGSLLIAVPALRLWAYGWGAPPHVLQWQTQFRADALAAGFFLATLYVHYGQVFAALLRVRYVWLVGLAGGVVFLASVRRDSGLGCTFGYTVAYLTAGCFFLLLYQAPAIKKYRVAVSPLGRLGIFSYGIYIWHAAAARVVVAALGRIGEFSPPLGAVMARPLAELVAKYAAAIAVGIVMTVLIEWPCLRLRRRLAPSPVDPEPVTEIARRRYPSRVIPGPRCRPTRTEQPSPR